MREVIVHHHIFKNAGSTIDAILKSQFGTELLSFEGEFPYSVVSPAALLEFICSHPDARVITSHQARLVSDADPRVKVCPIVLLRHPIDRVQSVYEFVRRQPPTSNPASQAAHALPFDQYVQWHLDRRYAVIRDYQTLFLSGRGTDMREITCDDVDLETAMTRLCTLPVFGLVEHFDESMRRFAAAYGHLGLADVSIVPENVRPARVDSLDARIDSIKAQLGSATYDALQRANRRDITLYECALSRFVRD